MRWIFSRERNNFLPLVWCGLMVFCLRKMTTCLYITAEYYLMFWLIRPGGAIWQHSSGSTLAHVMACCLMGSVHNVDLSSIRSSVIHYRVCIYVIIQDINPITVFKHMCFKHMWKYTFVRNELTFMNTWNGRKSGTEYNESWFLKSMANWLLNSLFRLTKKILLMLWEWDLLSGDWWFPLTNDPVMWEAFPCHDIIMSTSFYLQSKGHTELVDVIQYNRNRS